MEQQIVAIVFYSSENGGDGFQIYEEPYDSSIPVPNYRHQFEQRTREDHVAIQATLISLELTVHDEDGKYVEDENGRTFETIYSVEETE